MFMSFEFMSKSELAGPESKVEKVPVSFQSDCISYTSSRNTWDSKLRHVLARTYIFSILVTLAGTVMCPIVVFDLINDRC